jgi:hypothetical protein
LFLLVFGYLGLFRDLDLIFSCCFVVVVLFERGSFETLLLLLLLLLFLFLFFSIADLMRRAA